MFETATFQSVWYWIFMTFFWSLIGNWTFGVSTWALDRAKSSTEERALAATLGRRSIARTAYAVQHPPLVHWAFQAFILGAIATLGVLRGNEIAQGLLFVAIPMAGLEFWRRRFALRLAKAELGDKALLGEIAWARRVKQVIGAISIAAAAVFGMYVNRGDILWHFAVHGGSGPT